MQHINENIEIGNTNIKLADLTEKSAIMVYINKNITIAATLAWGQYRLPFNAVYRKIGNAFSLNTSTGEVAYSGNSKILKVTMAIMRSSETTCGNLYPTNSTLNMYYQTFATSSNPFAITNTIINATKGMLISPYIRPSGKGTIVLQGDGNSPYTYMIVEEL